ncbi:MAG: Ig-like domain-containing protein [Nocardioidaceae bacterium]|nr:Ig-like domain-containing protein [Nocardioidaceae bacterium]
MPARTRLLAVAGLALAALTFGMPGFSGATFTATSTSTGTVRAASDWTPPTVAVASPGSTVSGTVAVTATASDASGLASVRLEYAATGASTWTTLCTPAASPYTCSWNTTTIADGGYRLRAVATDTQGYAATSDVVTTTVLNAATLTLTDPGDNLRGSVALSATLTGTGSAVITTYRLEYSVADANAWTTICASTASPTLTCTWNTAALTNSYDIRAYAVVAGRTYTDLASSVTVDNTAPTGAVTAPVAGGTVSGTVSLVTSAADADSGVAGVVVQYAPTTTGSWTTACTVGASPWSCRFDTTALKDGGYDLRATITDAAGNTRTTATVAGVVVSNSQPSVSVESPTAGSYVTGATTVTASAYSTAGVAKVSIQARTGTAAYAEICSDTAAPYTCTWATTGSGSYDLRAVVTDTLGRTATSATVTVVVDNSALRAYDVQSAGSGTLGRLTAGDRLVLTYTAQVDLTTLKAGWNGSATTVAARVADGTTVGLTNNDDTFSVDGVALGTVNLGGNFVKKNKTATIPASTMVASTTTVNGVTATVVTITLGTPSGNLVTVSGTQTLRWTPSATARTPGGVAASVAPVAESGTADRDF